MSYRVSPEGRNGGCGRPYAEHREVCPIWLDLFGTRNTHTHPSIPSHGTAVEDGEELEVNMVRYGRRQESSQQPASITRTGWLVGLCMIDSPEDMNVMNTRARVLAGYHRGGVSRNTWPAGRSCDGGLVACMICLFDFTLLVVCEVCFDTLSSVLYATAYIVSKQVL